MKWINKNAPLLLLVLGFLTLVFGVIGHMGAIETPRVPPSLGPSVHDWTNALLTALSHLALEGFDAPDGSDLNWTNYAITASKVFATAVVIIGAANLLAAITNDFSRLHFWWRSRFGRDLDLIIGLGWHGKELIEHIESQRGTPGWVGGGKTLAIDSNASESIYELCKKSDVVCLRADIHSKSTFEKLNLKNFKRVYLVMGSDESHAQILRLLSSLVCEGQLLICHIGVNSPVMYHGFLETKEWSKGLDIRIFNDTEITSQMLLQHRPLVHTFPQNIKSSRLIMLGNGRMFNSILQQWLQNQIIEPSVNIEIDLLHLNPAGEAKKLIDRYPCFQMGEFEEGYGGKVFPKDSIWFSERVLPEIRFHQLHSSQSLQVQQIESLLAGAYFDNRTIVAVVTDTVTDSIQLARTVLPAIHYFSSTVDLNATKTLIDPWVYLNTQDVGLFSQLNDVLKTYHSEAFVFRDYLGECSKGSLSNDIVERAAMAVHASYLDLEEDPEKLWFGMAESKLVSSPASLWNRESSRLCGSHAWVKRGILKRLSDEDQQSSFQDLSPSILNDMGKIEHRRWCAVHLLRGWMPLVDLNRDSLNSHDQYLIKSWYESAELKIMHQQRFRHACLVSFANLTKLEDVAKLSGRVISEVDKDERLIKATDKILKYATESFN